jgi:hypothetical protein
MTPWQIGRLVASFDELASCESLFLVTPSKERAPITYDNNQVPSLDLWRALHLNDSQTQMKATNYMAEVAATPAWTTSTPTPKNVSRLNATRAQMEFCPAKMSRAGVNHRRFCGSDDGVTS